jgi:hypothetical protein
VSAISHLLPHRRIAGQVNAGVSDGITALGKSEGALLTGKNVRFRFGQSAYWGIIAGLMGAAVIAGFYDGLWEINWYVHVGPVHFEIFYLKNWWDNLIHYQWWTLYRHGAFRDLAEPAIATVGVKTVMASRKYWDTRIGGWEVAGRGLAVLGLTFALGIAGIWLIDFSLPWAWAHVASAVHHPGFKLSAHFLGKLSVPQLVLGLGVIGPIVHRVWAPAGATLQGALMDRAVDRRQSVVQQASADLAASIPGNGKSISMDEAVVIDRAGWHIIPVWVRLPLVPPIIRERFSEMWRGNQAVQTRKGRRAVIMILAFFLFLVMCLGMVGAHWAALGHTVPYLFPGH